MVTTKKRIVCIDPGHGGRKTGAVGPGGLREKDVVLAVGLLCAEALRSCGVDVRMTRETDEFIPLRRRAEISNAAGADCFVSIHCNSASRPTMGIETWVARGSKVAFPLGEAVQDAMCSEFPDHTDRGIKRAGFSVLVNTRCPAALAELEFLHVECGEKFLTLERTRQRYAWALAAGVLAFLGLGIPAKIAADDAAEGAASPPLSLSEQLGDMARRLVEISDMLKG